MASQSRCRHFGASIGPNGAIWTCFGQFLMFFLHNLPFSNVHALCISNIDISYVSNIGIFYISNTGILYISNIGLSLHLE